MTKLNIRPINDRLIVQRSEAETKTQSGIIIPDSAKEKPQEGVVVAAGKGHTNEAGVLRAMDVKVGDKILFGKYSGTEIKIEGEEYLMMKEEDVLGIIE